MRRELLSRVLRQPLGRRSQMVCCNQCLVPPNASWAVGESKLFVVRKAQGSGDPSSSCPASTGVKPKARERGHDRAEVRWKAVLRGLSWLLLVSLL